MNAKKMCYGISGREVKPRKLLPEYGHGSRINIKIIKKKFVFLIVY